MLAKRAGQSTKTDNSRYEAAERVLTRYENLLENAGSARARLFSELMDPRRDINAECGYPDLISPTQFLAMHRRNPYARRVNEVMAREACQTPLRIFESDDSEVDTPFEQDVDALGSQVQCTQSWHKDEEGSVIQSILMRAAIQAAIGHYGVILIGTNDGLDMSLPAAGVEEEFSMPGRLESQAGPAGWNDPYTGTSKTRTIATNAAVPKPEGPYSLRVDAKLAHAVPVLNRENGAVVPKAGKREITYIRVYPEAQAWVTRWEYNRSSPRFGQPVSYLISTVEYNSPNTTGYGTAIPSMVLDVHWTRVIHIPGQDISPNEVTSTPDTEPVWNNLMNLDKIHGAGGEGYWKSAFTPLSIETHPQTGPSPKINRSAVRDEVENFENSLTRILMLMGVTVKPITVDAKDPTPFIKAEVQAICIKKSIPNRIFMGSERGELSSTQDEGDWDDKLRAYQKTYFIPYVAVPFYDRLILLKVLTEPKEYHAEFDDVSAQSDKEIADVGLVKTTALAAAIAGNVFSVVPEQDYLTSFTKFYKDADAQGVLERSTSQEDQYDSDNQDLADEHGFEPKPPDGWTKPEPEAPLDPIKVKPGEKLVPHPAAAKQGA